jgi:hypothetical protein
MRAQEQWNDAAAFMDVNAGLARDPWSRSGVLAVKQIQPWTILLESVGITARGV